MALLSRAGTLAVCHERAGGHHDRKCLHAGRLEAPLRGDGADPLQWFRL